MKYWFILLLISVVGTMSCATEVDTIYDKLNTPLGVSVSVYEDSYLVSFYGYNVGKPHFKGYLLFQASSIEASRSQYQLGEAAVIIDIVTYPSLVNQDVNSAIQVKVGGSGTTSVLFATGALISGNYLTIRAYPDYPANQIDNIDASKGVAVSLPSNTVQIP